MNRKKYTNLKRKLFGFLIVVSTFFYFGCALKTTAPVAIPVAPAVSESALKDLNKVKVGIDTSIDSNAKIDSKVKEQLQKVLEQKLSIEDALSQAEKINEKVLAKQAITELDSLNLVNEIKKVKVRNLFLETQNTEFDKLVKDQSETLKITKLSAEATELKLRNKEQEANQLREQNTFLSKNLNDKNVESENLKKALTKEKQISASAKVYRNIIWTIAGVWLALLILKNVWMSVNPAARLRF
jgi:hypothetical protein